MTQKRFSFERFACFLRPWLAQSAVLSRRFAPRWNERDVLTHRSRVDARCYEFKPPPGGFFSSAHRAKALLRV